LEPQGITLFSVGERVVEEAVAEVDEILVGRKKTGRKLCQSLFQRGFLFLQLYNMHTNTNRQEERKSFFLLISRLVSLDVVY